MYLLLPLLSSLLYVAAALFLKEAATHGVGAWRTGFLCNWVAALLFLALWPMGGSIPSLGLLYQPAIVGLLFVIAQIFTFLSLQRGDVSVATPVLGSKVILVAFFTLLVTGESVRLTLWIAAACSCLGIGFLNRSGSSTHHHVVITILCALGAATGYAIFDVLVMTWSPLWGAGRFLPIAIFFAGVLSFAFLPFFGGSLRDIKPSAWRPLSCGAALIALQSIILVTALAIYGDATAMNVVYSTRGLWSVLAVWWLGHLFKNRERALGAAAMKSRLTGALFLCAAVVLVFV